MGSRNNIFEGLLREIERITAEIIVDLRRLPSYASVPADALNDGAAGHVRAMVSAARDRRTQITLQERRLFAQTGELRAQQGVPVEDLLRGWRIGVGHVWEETSAAADRSGVDYADRLADLQALLAFADNAMIVASSGHRQAELALARQDEQRRTQFLRAVLFGSLSAAELRIQAELYGLDTAQVYQPIRAHSSDRLAVPRLERALDVLPTGPRRAGLLATLEGDVVGFVEDRPAAAVDVAVGVGPPAALEEMAHSFGLATRALATATAFGLTGMVRFADLGLRPAVLADRDVSERLVETYANPLEAAASQQGALLLTAETYLACGMNVSRAAAELHVHANTLRYRLGRIRELTGMDFDDPDNICQLWWAIQAHKLSRSA